MSSDADRDLAQRADVKTFRAFVAAQVATFQRQLAPLALMGGIGDIEAVFEHRAPSYVGDAWQSFLAAGRAMLQALDRWKDEEHGSR